MLLSINNIEKNETVLRIGNITLFFSYEIIVAFKKGDRKVCCENVWSKTTGKFLNYIEPDKKARISVAKFKEELADVLKTIRVE